MDTGSQESFIVTSVLVMFLFYFIVKGELGKWVGFLLWTPNPQQGTGTNPNTPITTHRANLLDLATRHATSWQYFSGAKIPNYSEWQQLLFGSTWF